MAAKMAEFKLTEIVERVDNDKLVIPEFQRGFKWQTPDIRKLLESLLLDFPIGAALFWRTQRSTLDFRRVEDVQFSDDENEEDTVSERNDETALEEIDFILDGQQRITSIYKLFPTELAPPAHELESRFKGLRFFLLLKGLVYRENSLISKILILSSITILIKSLVRLSKNAIRIFGRSLDLSPEKKLRSV